MMKICPRRLGWLLGGWAVLSTANLMAASLPAFPPSRLVFVEGKDGGFTFDTGEVKGTLRAQGKSIGLTSIVHEKAGVRLDRGQGLLSPYRVLSEDKRYGTALWDVPSVARVSPGGAVEVYWEASSERPFELWSTYKVTAHTELELTVAVRAQALLPGFEVFVASYFGETFTNAVVYAVDGAQPDKQGRFLPALKAEGEWQLFPRDAAATALVRDGRWKQPPSPVDWTVRSEFAAPVAARQQGEVGQVLALVYAPATECFAVSTPYQEEPHTSLYFSLFGRTLQPGETGVARLRVRLLRVSTSAMEPLVSRLVQSMPALP